MIQKQHDYEKKLICKIRKYIETTQLLHIANISTHNNQAFYILPFISCIKTHHFCAKTSSNFFSHYLKPYNIARKATFFTLPIFVFPGNHFRPGKLPFYEVKLSLSQNQYHYTPNQNCDFPETKTVFAKQKQSFPHRNQVYPTKNEFPAQVQFNYFSRPKMSFRSQCNSTITIMKAKLLFPKPLEISRKQPKPLLATKSDKRLIYRDHKSPQLKGTCRKQPLSCLLRFILLCFQPYRKWPLDLTEWSVGRLATCPPAQLADYPVNLDAVVGLIDQIVQLFAWLAGSWPGWPVLGLVGRLQVRQLSRWPLASCPFLIPIFHRNFREDTHSDASIFENESGF